jgi:hypothetical protein
VRGRPLTTLLVALGLLLGCCGIATAANGNAEGAAAESLGRPPIALGTFIHDSYQRPQLYDQFTREVGRAPVVIGSYKSWSIPLIDTEQLNEIWSRGAVPMITWEPWGRQEYRLRDIARGRYDGYVNRSAAAAVRWDRPFFLRFAHEMNGGWYPWGRGTNGNTPRIYRKAWRHIVRIFRAHGADKVRWVWAPNQNFSGRYPFKRYYPGDSWVDWMGLDGFNWQLSPRWQSFDEIFAGSYDSLVRLSRKPVMIAETGSWENGGSKEAWVSRALTLELPKYQHIRALVWWSENDPRGDLRVNSSPMALRSLRAGVRSPLFETDRAQLLATPEELPGRPTLNLGGHESVAKEIRSTVKQNYVWLGVGVLALCLVILAFALAKSARGQRPSGHTPSA